MMNKRHFCAAVLTALLLLSACARTPEAKRDRYLAAGNKLLAKKDYGRAILEFNNAVQVTPKDAESYYRLGLAYLGAGQLGPGVACLRRATELNPQHAAAQIRMAEILQSTGDRDLLENAEKRMEGILNGTVDNADAVHALALTELNLGRPQEAIQYLERALQKFPKHLASSVALAQARLSQNDLKGAETVLRDACRRDSSSAEAHIALGRFLNFTRRPADAEHEFDAARGLDPKNGIALMDLAMTQRALGNKKAAEENFKQLAGYSDDRFKPVYALFLQDEGRRAEAVQQFETIWKDNPKNYEFRTMLVSAYLSVGRTQDAERLLNAALKKNPKDLDALLQRSEINLDAGRYAQAELDLNQVIHYRPDSAQAHYILAKTAEKRGAVLTQRQELSEALRLNENLLKVRLELAELLIKEKSPKTAVEILDKTPASQNVLPVIVERNWALLAIPDYAEARKGIDRGLMIERSPALIVQDGFWKLSQKNYAGAQAQMQEALKINKADVRALDGLMRVFTAEKKSDAGMQVLKQAAAEQQKAPEVQKLLGSWLLANGQLDEAKKAFAAEENAAPGSIEPILSQLSIEISQGQLDSARKRVDSLLLSSANDLKVQLYAGEIDARTGKTNDALAHYRKVLEANPTSTVALNNMAYVLANSGQAAAAQAFAQQVKEMVPENSAISDTLGWTFFQRGLYSEAVRHLKDAAQHSSDPVIQYHLAMAYFKHGSVEQAKEVFAKVNRTAPNLPEATMASALLKSPVQP